MGDWKWRLGKLQIRLENLLSKNTTGRGGGSRRIRIPRKTDQLTVTVFVSNFPEMMTSKDLWSLCERHGTVANVHIGRKLSKIGKQFAFI